jgi:hypothetical protein
MDIVLDNLKKKFTQIPDLNPEKSQGCIWIMLVRRILAVGAAQSRAELCLDEADVLQPGDLCALRRVGRVSE